MSLRYSAGEDGGRRLTFHFAAEVAFKKSQDGALPPKTVGSAVRTGAHALWSEQRTLHTDAVGRLWEKSPRGVRP